MDLNCVKVMKKKKMTFDWSTNLWVLPMTEKIVEKRWTRKTQQNKTLLALQNLVHMVAKLEPLYNLHSSYPELFIQVHDLRSHLWTLLHVAPSEWLLSSLIKTHLFFRQKGNTSLMSCLTRSHTPTICLLYYLSFYILLLWHLSYSIINVHVFFVEC